ncbi:hypothetical protein KSS87_012569, partial [Heliosperma pusillum]
MFSKGPHIRNIWHSQQIQPFQPCFPDCIHFRHQKGPHIRNIWHSQQIQPFQPCFPDERTVN